MRPRDDVSSARVGRELPGAPPTVTRLLEAYAGERIEVVKLLQEFDCAGEAGTALDLSPDDRVIRRRVLLTGAASRRTFAYAEAVVALARAEPELLEGLLATDKPIGTLLAEQRIEASRHLVGVDRGPAGRSGAYFGMDASAELVSRTYTMVWRRQPMILIVEKLPPTIFRRVSA